MALKCFYYDVTQLSDQRLFDKGMSELFWRERAERVKRYRFEKDRRLCLGAGLLAEDMLRSAGADDLTLTYNGYGKPSLAKYPHICFNISHDGDMAVCAVADVPTGVDVQKITACDTKVADMVMQPDEIRYITSEKDTAAAFTRLWTRKESYIKLIGKGMSLDMSSFSVLCMQEKAFFTEYAVGEYMICICCSVEKEVLFSEWRYDAK